MLINFTNSIHLCAVSCLGQLLRVSLVAIFFTGFSARFAFANVAELNKNTMDDNKRSYDMPQLPKIMHAEPLYIDLIRDLGARKGEAEYNFGFGMSDKRKYVEYLALVEYEWAVIDRLGLEIEFPFYYTNPYRNLVVESAESNIPGNKLDSMKLAGQYTFFVSEKHSLSMATGYIHEFLMNDIAVMTKENFYQGNVFNPFFVIAKRIGNNFHTLLYTGPFIESFHNQDHASPEYHFNINFHYMISSTRNFLGLETNIRIVENSYSLVFRPQLRLSISENFLMGIVASVPSDLQSRGMGFFIRAIYEPSH